MIKEIYNRIVKRALKILDGFLTASQERKFINVT